MAASKNSEKQRSVLVTLATGKLGVGVCQAFVEEGWNVFGTSRNAHHAKLLNMGVTPVEFKFGCMKSIQCALQTSQQPDVVVVITSMMCVSKAPQKELEHAKMILNACVGYEKKPFIILCSSDMAEACPNTVRHCKSKYFVEQYLKALDDDAEYAILRPSSFMENFDDPTVYNPLQYGKLRDLYPSSVKVPLVATRDVGRAAVEMASNPNQWMSKTLVCVADVQSGEESAQILSQVAQVPISYSQAPPLLIQWLILRDLYHMVQYTTAHNATFDNAIATFRNVVPKAMTVRDWFQAKGQWSDGTKFGELKRQEARSLAKPLAVGVVVVAAAAAALAWK